MHLFSTEVCIVVIVVIKLLYVLPGFIYDATGSYDASFCVGGFMMSFGGLICCLLHLNYFQQLDDDSSVDSNPSQKIPKDEDVAMNTKNLVLKLEERFQTPESGFTEFKFDPDSVKQLQQQEAAISS